MVVWIGHGSLFISHDVVGYLLASSYGPKVVHYRVAHKFFFLMAQVDHVMLRVMKQMVIFGYNFLKKQEGKHAHLLPSFFILSSYINA